MDGRLDRVLTWVTPMLVGAVLTISVLLLAITQREWQQQAERSEMRTERLTQILVEGRDEWGPALQHSLHILSQLCESDPDCTPP